jgi:hypothetical protein
LAESPIGGVPADVERGADHRPRVAGSARIGDGAGEISVRDGQRPSRRGDSAPMSAVAAIGGVDIEAAEHVSTCSTGIVLPSLCSTLRRSSRSSSASASIPAMP